MPNVWALSAAADVRDLVLPLAALALVAALAAYASIRSTQRVRTRTTRGGAPAAGGEGPAALADLDPRTSRLLADTDDAVRTSTEELGWATAQLGAQATAPFREALARAHSDLAAAFRLRQRLDDAIPEDDTAARRMADEIVERCTEALRRLDEQAEAFDRVRALDRDPFPALARAEAALRDVTGRADTAQAMLTALGSLYAATAVLPMAGHVEQARHRLVFAASHLDRARKAVDAGDNARAAVHLRPAEGALAQAALFVDALDRVAKELAEAVGRLPAALAEAENDLAEARRALAGGAEGVSSAELYGRIARAEATTDQVRMQVEAGPYDPVAALRRLEEADAALDGALAGARADKVSTRHARALLNRSLLTARNAVGTAEDFVTTHRAAVGSRARTRLAEARRHLARAHESEALIGAAGFDEAGVSADPATALAEAQWADALAREAQQLAELDVRGYGHPYGGVPGSGREEDGTGSAVLGGILVAGGVPAAFGGGDTRARRGPLADGE